MNIRQVWGLAGGFFFVYVLITLTNKPAVRPKRESAASVVPAAASAAPEDAGKAGAPAQAEGRVGGFTLLPPDGEHLAGPDGLRAMRAMAAQGARWVSLQPAITQPSGSTAEVPGDPAASLVVEDTRGAVQAAKEAGLKVMLRPLLTPGDGTPRDAITPVDPEVWLVSYGRAMAPYLSMAEAEHIEIVCLGSRLGKVQSAIGWTKLIDEARKSYRGKLTYAASHEAEAGYRAVAFWGSLDYVGIDAFFPLADTAGPQAKDLEAGWRRAADEIEAWRISGGPDKPVLFTSAGVPRLVGAAAAPGRPDKAAPEDEKLQTAAYSAFFQTVWTRPWLAGVIWHTWAEGESTDYYAVAGRPAVDVVKAYFGEGAPAAAAPDQPD